MEVGFGLCVKCLGETVKAPGTGSFGCGWVAASASLGSEVRLTGIGVGKGLASAGALGGGLVMGPWLRAIGKAVEGSGICAFRPPSDGLAFTAKRGSQSSGLQTSNAAQSPWALICPHLGTSHAKKHSQIDRYIDI